MSEQDFNEQLMSLLVQYYKDNSIDPSVLSDAEKQSVVTMFMTTQEVKKIILQAAGIDNYDNFGGLFGGLIDKFAGPLISKANDITNNVIGKVAGAVGIKGNALDMVKNVLNPANLLSGGAAQSDINKQNQANDKALAELTAQQIAAAKAGLTMPTAAGNPADAQAVALAAQEAAKAATDADKKKKIMLFGGIGLGVLVIAAVLFFVLKRKK